MSVIIKLTGGLGNQLFQYAYGRSLSIARNTPLLLDTSWYKGRINRTYTLDSFNINAKKIGLIHKLFRHQPILSDTTGDWHQEIYFQHIKTELKQELTLKNNLNFTNLKLLDEIRKNNSVSIHIRGGDYVHGNKSFFHGTCSSEYYTKALTYIKNKVTTPHFYIFTDDLEWARTVITYPEPYTIVSYPDNLPAEELILMSECKSKIIANSTFSWWAAWLGSTSGIVIAPKKWFNDSKFNDRKINLQNWIQF